MDAKEYIDLCRRVSLLPSGVYNIKKDVPEELLVVYDGRKYYPVARRASFDNEGHLIISAELHDLNANSVTVCSLEKVERFKVEK